MITCIFYFFNMDNCENPYDFKNNKYFFFII